VAFVVSAQLTLIGEKVVIALPLVIEGVFAFVVVGVALRKRYRLQGLSEDEVERQASKEESMGGGGLVGLGLKALVDAATNRQHKQRGRRKSTKKILELTA
jgi:hypothetical protein